MSTDLKEIAAWPNVNKLTLKLFVKDRFHVNWVYTENCRT